MKITILEDVTSCILKFLYRNFVKTYCLQFYDREKSEVAHFFKITVNNQNTHRYIQEDINRLNKKRINSITNISWRRSVA
jgi:hypothetical protein